MLRDGIRFVTIGAVSSLIVLTITAFLTAILGIFYPISTLIASEISIFFAFFSHDKWTFSHVPKTTQLVNRFLKFNASALVGIGLNELILISLTTKLDLNYIISEGIAILITFIFNFTISKKIIWKLDPHNTQRSEKSP